MNALVYKNWFWWGLDMVADGNVLIYTAGIWYLLVPLLVGRELFGANVVKTVIMVDLLVSHGRVEPPPAGRTGPSRCG